LLAVCLSAGYGAAALWTDEVAVDAPSLQTGDVGPTIEPCSVDPLTWQETTPGLANPASGSDAASLRAFFTQGGLSGNAGDQLAVTYCLQTPAAGDNLDVDLVLTWPDSSEFTLPVGATAHVSVEAEQLAADGAITAVSLRLDNGALAAQLQPGTQVTAQHAAVDARGSSHSDRSAGGWLTWRVVLSFAIDDSAGLTYVDPLNPSPAEVTWNIPGFNAVAKQVRQGEGW
jgi:hypothetical protein